MPHLVGAAIIIGVLTIVADVASAASINPDAHAISLTSDRTRLDIDGTIFIPTYPTPGRSNIADAQLF